MLRKYEENVTIMLQIQCEVRIIDVLFVTNR